MRRGGGAECPDEARLGRLLERTYAAREARVAPADDALARLNAALDAIEAKSPRHADHRRLLGVCAVAMLVLLLLSPVVRAEFTASTRHATQSAITPMSGAIGGGVGMPPVAIAAREAGSGAPNEVSNAPGHAPAPNGTTLTTGASDTPLRDLLSRAGIQPSDSPHH
jgi:hypothetical protein